MSDMPVTIGTVGAIEREGILVRTDTELPDTLRAAREPFLSARSRILDFRPAELDCELGKVGWNFFIVATEIQASGLARDLDRALQKPFARLLGKAEAEKLNVTNITTKTHLRLRLVGVRAHLRHIQESPLLFKPRVRPGEPAIRMAA